MELIFDFGPGYRIYFARLSPVAVLFLCGGDKSTQTSDIVAAKEYWRDHRTR
jgi:putative addiction module killer protein